MRHPSLNRYAPPVFKPLCATLLCFLQCKITTISPLPFIARRGRTIASPSKCSGWPLLSPSITSGHAMQFADGAAAFDCLEARPPETALPRCLGFAPTAERHSARIDCTFRFAILSNGNARSAFLGTKHSFARGRLLVLSPFTTSRVNIALPQWLIFDVSLA